MERKLRYAWWVVLIGLVALAVWKLFLPNGSTTYVQKSASSREIIVYVAGAVEKPMLVHLPPDARLNDALMQVRPLPEANLESMNPAEKLKDGQKITVPYKPVALPPPPIGDSTSVVNSPTVTTPIPASQVSIVSPVAADGRININSAGLTELDKLPGIGPALAERIITYRTEHGPFAQPEDLKNVSGIGTKTFEKMADQVTVSP